MTKSLETESLVIAMNDSQNAQKESPEAVFKLSKYKKKKNDVPPKEDNIKPRKRKTKGQVRKKRRRTDINDRIPIPSFSPTIRKELSVCLLATTPSPEPENRKSPLAFVIGDISNNEYAEDDDLPPPVFQANHLEKESFKPEKKDEQCVKVQSVNHDESTVTSEEPQMNKLEVKRKKNQGKKEQVNHATLSDQENVFEDSKTRTTPKEKVAERACAASPSPTKANAIETIQQIVVSCVPACSIKEKASQSMNCTSENGSPSRQRTSTANREMDQLNPSPKRRKKAKPKKENTVDYSETNRPAVTESEENTGSGTVPKRPRKQKKRARCALCSSCSCQQGKSIAKVEMKSLADLSKNNVQIERALRSRLQKLEKTTNYYEDLTEQIRRQYKKHRREMVRKQEEQLGIDEQRPFGESRFLPDAEKWESNAQESHEPPLEDSQVLVARSSIFPPGKCYQPTLTQMLGEGKENNNEQETSIKASERDVGVPVPCAKMEIEVEVSDRTDNCTEREVLPTERVINVMSDKIDSCCESELAADRDFVDRVHRLSWRVGLRDAVHTRSPVRGVELWASIRDLGASHMQSCLWDNLFCSSTERREFDGLDHLVGLIDEQGLDRRCKFNVESGHQTEPFAESSLLTSRMVTFAAEIEKKIEGDVAKRKAVGEVCPNWKENIRFAMLQKENDVMEALENVRMSRKGLETAKTRMLQCIERQQAGLDFFERTLEASIEQSRSLM